LSIEGGNFQCYIHHFETPNVKEWNEHMTETLHTEEGSTRCRDCDKVFNFKNLPFKPFDDKGHKNISLSCPDCQGNHQYEIVEVEVDGE